MIVEAKLAMLDGENKVVLVPTEVGNIKLNRPCVLSIDGSTTITGVAILTEDKGWYVGSIAYKHEKDKETAVQYKVRLKKSIKELLDNNPLIKEIFYEEPFIGYVQAAKNLLMLRTFVEEIKAENEPDFDYISITEINNLKWKKLFLAPDKCPTGTELQKEKVRKKLVDTLTFLDSVTQDEIDAIAMGSIAAQRLADDEKEELGSKKKAKSFQYKCQFLAGDNDDIIWQEIYDVYEAPEEVMSNGMKMITLNGRMKWDETIYSTMGDEDKLLILKFKSNKYGNIILKHRIGHLAEGYQYIYALIWRKNRKR